MSVLGHNRIRQLLSHDDIDQRLIVTPLLDPTQVGEASIDVRIGNDFIVTRRGNLGSIDPLFESTASRRYQAKHFTNFGDKFYLHPGELVLAGTLEYFRLPTSVEGHVTSRSSWGRTGLVIATATAVHPGFTGVVTLELINLGEVPLVLYPGACVAQIVLTECDGATEYSGRFSLNAEATFPSFDKADRNTDLGFWVAHFERQRGH